jgi:ribonuclease BN (tRNA processing enzyme)
MRVVFLGTGGYHPNERRHTAGVFLPEAGLLFDAGTCLFRLPARLMRDDLTVALSHAHLDHVCGLTYLLVPLHRRQLTSLGILGSERTLETVRNHLFAARLFPVMPECSMTPLNGHAERELADGMRLRHQPLESHPGASLAYRLDWLDEHGQPRSLAYVTDTCVDGSYTNLVRGVDLLIHECYFTDDLTEWADRTGHSHTSAVAALARDAGVKRLILTHIDPQREDDDPVDLPRARAIFPHTDVAEDLWEVEV